MNNQDAKFGIRGIFKAVLRDKNGRVKSRHVAKNGATTVGINHVLDVVFRNQSQSANWYAGLIDNASFSALAAADTMSSHSGWTESTDYDETTRNAWAPGAASNRVLTTTIADFTVTTGSTFKGVFLVDNNTKGGTSGTLWATGAFDSNITATTGETVGITYEIEIVPI